MSASLVGSEMCIRDRGPTAPAGVPAKDTRQLRSRHLSHLVRQVQEEINRAVVRSACRPDGRLRTRQCRIP
eukprot:10090151-Alexandrium_andersonii.AAC.1